jgi:hypothetical protein
VIKPAPLKIDPPIGAVISPAVMLSPNAKYFSFESVASFVLSRSG